MGRLITSEMGRESGRTDLHPEDGIHPHHLLVCERSADDQREEQGRGDVKVFNKPPMEVSVE
jgi:hypothetical protein